MKKESYFVIDVEGKKLTTIKVEGYTHDFDGIKVGFCKGTDGWKASELSTGFLIATEKTRKASVAFVEENLDGLKGKLADASLDKYRKAIDKAYGRGAEEVAKEPEEEPKKPEPKVKAKGKFDIYETVTDRIVKQLEEGIIPWHKPWTGVIDGAFNRVSKKPYSILNQCMLKHKGEYASFKQWKELGGHVKKGEHPEMVVFWKMVKKEIEEDGEKKTKIIPMLRYYNVFHISQTEGVEPLKDGLKAINSLPMVDVVIEDYATREGVEIRHEKGNKAYYSPSGDYVVLPLMEQFKTKEGYYSTAFHELTHSTGHKSRLNRIDRVAAFGDEEYSREELVAEIGSAGLMNRLGLETKGTFKNSAAYIQSWIKALKNDKKMIVVAAGKAEKAISLILGEEKGDKA